MPEGVCRSTISVLTRAVRAFCLLVGWELLAAPDAFSSLDSGLSGLARDLRLAPATEAGWLLPAGFIWEMVTPGSVLTPLTSAAACQVAGMPLRVSAGLGFLTPSRMLSCRILSHCCLCRSRCPDTSRPVQTVLTAIGQDRDQLRVHDMLLVSIIKGCRQGKPARQRCIRQRVMGTQHSKDLRSVLIGCQVQPA